MGVEVSLAKINEDLELAVNCAYGITKQNKTNINFVEYLKDYVVGGFDALVGPKPILYTKEEAWEKMAAKWIDIVKKDTLTVEEYEDNARNSLSHANIVH